MRLHPKDRVRHSEYGVGTIEEIFGSTAKVIFFGDPIDVPIGELVLIASFAPKVLTADLQQSRTSNEARNQFRRAFEALNLGVVPPDNNQHIDLTIGGELWSKTIPQWLNAAPVDGLCKVAFGYYGAGKSHFLKLVQSIAIKDGWVVAFLEFDPKAADPAKPHLIYKNITSALRFPQHVDGSKVIGFAGLIKEIREKWDTKELRECLYLKRNPWFSNAIEILIKHPHSMEGLYASACGWLSGENQPLQIMNQLASQKGLSNRVPRMPKVKETAEIYVLHLVTIHHLCKSLGYKGLVIILDEAEHVRGYNVLRRERANHLFDLLARSAHRPNLGYESTASNDHGFLIYPYWKEGPHFCLFVGLTEGEAFQNGESDPREKCVFLHSYNDRVLLQSPTSKDYQDWCEKYLEQVHLYYPSETEVLSSVKVRRHLSQCLNIAFVANQQKEVTLRSWIKLASLVPSMILANNIQDENRIVDTIERLGKELCGELQPWE